MSDSAAADYASRPWRKLYPPGLDDLDARQPLVLDRLAGHAGSRPDAPALVYFGQTLTWAEVDELSSRFAAALAERGHAASRVGVFLQNMPQFAIAALGAWKAGCAVIPLNPMLKAAELEHIFTDAGPTVLVALYDLLTDPVLAVAQAAGITLVCGTGARELAGELAGLAPDSGPAPGGVQRFAELCAPGPANTEPANTGPANTGPAGNGRSAQPALITYTSGTTGRPKGAVTTHANLAFNGTAMADWTRVGADDVIIAVAPLFHITGLVGQFIAGLAAGAPMVLGFRFEPGLMLRLIERHRATFAIGAITAFIALLDHPERPSADLSSLVKVFSGGAPVAPAVVARFEREIGPYIHNAYGLTETTAATHLVPYGARAPVDPVSGALSIGVPYANTVARIADDSGADLPAGQVGELIIDGPQVAAGYLNQPAASRQAFTPGGLRTGDVGFMDCDGWFYLVDRKKDMIVASGYKVWPREVEDVLYQHPAVREAAVIGVPDEYRGEQVRAFVSLKPGSTADPAEIVAFCRERLANYKAPRAVAIVAELPKTASGKILRRSLRDGPG